MTGSYTRPLVLDRPCEYCKVLELDDLEHGGQIKHDQHQKPYVDFGDMKETEETKAEMSVASRGAIRALWYATNGRPHPDELQIVPRTELKIGYTRTDVLPGLPDFAATAIQGCAFCSVLREDIISATSQGVNLETQDCGSGAREVVITEVSYQFRKVDFGRHEDAPKVWLDALYIYFTVDTGAGKVEQSLHYTFYADAWDPCAQWLGVSRLPVVNERLSDPSLDRLKTLIDYLSREAPVIQNDNDPSFLPTRLLDVEASCPSGLQLIITKTNPEVSRLAPAQRRYAALSYCWGSAAQAQSQLKTTRDTLASHLTEIDINTVPKTISDAIKVCRNLGVRYLWVDALCIIQGDVGDWNRESFAMSQVYSESFVALCVTRGDSCSSGFLEPDYTPPTVQINFRSRLESTVLGNLYLRMQHPPHENVETGGQDLGKPNNARDDPSRADLDHSAWNTRGWTFQEDWLAPRKLYFGELMFYASAGELHEAADGTSFSRNSHMELQAAGFENSLGSWYSLADEYMRRQLSFEQDRLPAVSALARSVGERFPELQYVAGLWASDLHRGLLWTTNSSMEFDQYYNTLGLGPASTAPSWSWACRPYPISWVSGITNAAEVRYSPEIKVDCVEVPAVDSANPYGRVSCGRLYLQGKVFKPPLCADGRPRVKTGTFTKFLGVVFNYILWSEEDQYIAYLFLDWDCYSAHRDHEVDRGCPPGPLDQLSLLLVSRTSFDQHFMFTSHDLDDQEAMLGILIRHVPGTDKEYEKLGIWCSESRDLGGAKFWKEIPMREVILR